MPCRLFPASGFCGVIFPITLFSPDLRPSAAKPQRLLRHTGVTTHLPQQSSLAAPVQALGLFLASAAPMRLAAILPASSRAPDADALNAIQRP